MLRMIKLCFSTVKSSISSLIGVDRLSLRFITRPICHGNSLDSEKILVLMINHFLEGTSKNFEGL